MGEIAQRTFNLADLVVWRDGSASDLDSLRAHTRTLVAGYKVPKEFHVFYTLQRTPAGKPGCRRAKTRAVELSS
jgi:3-oxocholest-4-en-26-oate---CoA ligase